MAVGLWQCSGLLALRGPIKQERERRETEGPYAHTTWVTTKMRSPFYAPLVKFETANETKPVFAEVCDFEFGGSFEEAEVNKGDVIGACRQATRGSIRFWRWTHARKTELPETLPLTSLLELEKIEEGSWNRHTSRPRRRSCRQSCASRATPSPRARTTSSTSAPRFCLTTQPRARATSSCRSLTARAW